uniref:Probable multidrug resistance-associated protein lethal(2)03659 n=3 Tax=Cacopsylla melanoneura TaxID=428564 RepID=A0A8D8Y1X0_9HEMI
MDAGKKKYDKPPHPRATCNVLSALTFSWTLGLFREGRKRDLEVTDLYEPLKEHTSSYLGNKLERYWNDELVQAQKRGRDPSFLRALIRCFGLKMASYGLVLAFMECVLRICQPFLLGRVIDYFSPPAGVSPLLNASTPLLNLTGVNRTSLTGLSIPPLNATLSLVAGAVTEMSPHEMLPNPDAFLSSAHHHSTLEEASLYAMGVIMSILASNVLMHCFMMAMFHLGMKIRVGTCSLIYRKALRLSKTALGETTVGQVVNLLSNDVNRFDTAFIFLHHLWVGPLLTVIVTYFLYDLIGLSSLIGVAVLLAFIPFQIYLGKKTSELRLKTALRTDERVRLMNEIISGIQVIKMYAWEKSFASMVTQARKKEIRQIKGSTYIKGVLLSFIIFHTRIALFCSILAYVLSGHGISAEKVFVVTAYFNILRQSMTVFFPQGIGMTAEALVSVKRLQKFLMYDETQVAPVQIPPPSSEDKTSPMYEDTITSLPHNGEVEGSNHQHTVTSMGNGRTPSQTGIFIKNIKAKWLPDQPEYTLNNITLDVKPGKLVAVIGPVGAGKSSLFQAILRELPVLEGSIEVAGSISYASQEPWLFAGSVRSNILFGLPMDKNRYRRVVKVCALKADFAQLPQGDRSLVGDKGVSLSGGQRARISLARAVYKRADVYLLDDPLSAVDSHVGRHLFEDCITGFLKEKTVMLITHQIQYLTNCDHVMLLEKGSVEAFGTTTQLLASGLDFTQLLDAPEEEKGDGGVEGEEDGGSVGAGAPLHPRQSSVRSVASSIDDIGAGYEELLADQETRSTGGISTAVFKAYFHAGGSVLFLVYMSLMFLFTQITASGSDYWITYWVNSEERAAAANVTFSHSVFSGESSELLVPSSALLLGISLTRLDFIYLFTAITVAMVFFTVVRSIAFVQMCMRASMKLHNQMFDSITQATMYFFNKNPAGRILNRFSKDIGAIDELLPSILIDLFQIGLTLIGIIIVVAVVNVWLLIPTFVVLVIFYVLRVFYLSTSRSVKRLEGITRSPVFSHLSASLQGLTTIRAFEAQPVLVKEFDNHQDLHSSAWYLFIASNRAFGFWLDAVCLVYIALVTFSFFVTSNKFFGGDVGLAITQAIGLTGMFQWGMRQSAEFVNQMTSVERVLEYANIEKEPPLESAPDKQPPPRWPEHGKIEFNGMSLRYGPQEAPVLKNLTFTIQPMEKVGIVGRTGAGKSSLIQALFRLAINEGSIRIDGIETADLGLHDLRSRLSIIPQEPVLFSGSMRKNLDPFDEFPDAVLWNALEEVELKPLVHEMAGGLNTKMSEGGTNFSVGQRQLVCLARAIIRNNRVLVMDEATANVDPQTDTFIQQTIREKFAACTVLTIAHRLHTVMDSDKVLVMDAGSLVEFDHPHILLKNEAGIFYGMVEKTGRGTAENLHRIAAESYKKKYFNNTTTNDQVPSVEEKKDL